MDSRELTTAAVIETAYDLERIEPEWRQLWLRDPAATPFQSPDWLIPWTRHLWCGGKLRVIVLRRAEELAAVAPFFLWGYGSQPEVIRLSFVGSGISDYLGITCDPEIAAEAAESVVSWLTLTCRDWDLCDLQELSPDSPLLCAVLRRQLADALPCSVCPVLQLQQSVDGQMAVLEPSFRRSLRTAGKRLNRAGRVEFLQGTRATQEEILDRLFALHASRWEERGESGVLSTAALRTFHREVARRFGELGWLRLFALVLNDRCIAVQYNFAAKKRVYAYLSGFDPAWSRCSPGAVLLAHSIRTAIEEGAREFDFLRHAEAFKYSWRAIDRPTKRFLISR